MCQLKDANRRPLACPVAWKQAYLTIEDMSTPLDLCVFVEIVFRVRAHVTVRVPLGYIDMDVKYVGGLAQLCRPGDPLAQRLVPRRLGVIVATVPADMTARRTEGLSIAASRSQATRRGRLPGRRIRADERYERHLRY